MRDVTGDAPPLQRNVCRSFLSPHLRVPRELIYKLVRCTSWSCRINAGVGQLSCSLYSTKSKGYISARRLLPGLLRDFWRCVGELWSFLAVREGHFGGCKRDGEIDGVIMAAVIIIEGDRGQGLAYMERYSCASL
jgi:hypothetical protein